jgi:putative flavoprotein involved in K+ transport
METNERYDAVVVGAGQAGLAMGYFLAQQERRFVLLEAGDTIGPAWRERWDSLRLFTPRRYDGLPGLAFPGDPDGYPTRDEVVAYLEQYAATFDLPVELDSRVTRLTAGDGGLRLELDGRTIEADNVVVATGPFQTPFVPDVSARLAPGVFQTHATGYRRPEDVPGERVLVVGGGNTGYQIAAELAATRRVQLAVGSRQTPLPQRFLGRDIFWWLTTTRLLDTTVDSRLGSRMQHRDTLIGSSPRTVQRLGVTLRPRVVDVDGSTVRFADGTELEVDAVIWATGYRPDHGWLDVPVLADDGSIRHRRGVTDVPGLFFLGLPWQHTRGSALLGWVKDDAAFIADRIAARSATAAERDDHDRPAAPAGVTEGA